MLISWSRKLPLPSIFRGKDTGGKGNVGEDVEGKGLHNKDDGTGKELNIRAAALRNRHASFDVIGPVTSLHFPRPHLAVILLNH